MCLSGVTKIYKAEQRPYRKIIGRGYKVIITHRDSWDTLFERTGLRPYDKWLKRKADPRLVASDGGRLYPNGFHLFRSAADAAVYHQKLTIWADFPSDRSE